MMGVNIVARLLGLDNPKTEKIEPRENQTQEMEPKVEIPIMKETIKGKLEDIRGSGEE